MEITEIATGLQFPEGPVWMPDGTVLCVELKGRTVDRVHLDGRVETVATPGGSPNGLAIGPDGAAYVCNSGGWGFAEVMGMTVPDVRQPEDYSGGRIERVDLATGEVTVLYTECDGNELVGPNDLVFDAAGGMWFTDHGKQRGRVHDDRRRLLRRRRRLLDPRGDLPARLAERHRPLTRGRPPLRGRDPHRPRVLVADRVPGRARPRPDRSATAARCSRDCPGCSCWTRSGSTVVDTSSSARSSTVGSP